jgi:hypothetical protein
MRTFDPWVGKRYTSEGIRGVRLLILGESHYGTAGAERRTFTADMVRRLGQEGRRRFFSAAQRLVVGGQGRLSAAERAGFWERVAFYNYVQSFPGPRARCRPTPEMWSAAREPFLHTLAEVAPRVLLVLGRELRRHLPELPAGVAVCAVQHPSSRGFRYGDWQPAVQAIMAAAEAEPSAADRDRMSRFGDFIAH